MSPIGFGSFDDDDPDDGMGSMFAPVRKGSWWVSSKSDPRWNGSGRALVGSFMMPQEAKDHIEAKKRELGTDPPADCEWGYDKD